MQMSLVGQLFGFKAFVASQRLVHSFLCCSRKAFSECLSTECVNQYKASTSYPPPWVTPLGVWTSEDWFVQIPIFLVKKKKRHFIPLEGLYNSGSNSLPHQGGGGEVCWSIELIGTTKSRKNKILTSNQYQWFLPLCGKLIKVLQ